MTALSHHTGRKKRFGFPGNEKLKSKKRIGQLFSEGSSISAYPLKLIYLKTHHIPDGTVRVGVTVPKKIFKSAVKRNRIKRLLRESYRLNKEQIFNNIDRGFAFLFLYLGKDMPLYRDVEFAMLKLLKEFLKRTSDAKIDP